MKNLVFALTISILSAASCMAQDVAEAELIEKIEAESQLIESPTIETLSKRLSEAERIINDLTAKIAQDKDASTSGSSEDRDAIKGRVQAAIKEVFERHLELNLAQLEEAEQRIKKSRLEMQRRSKQLGREVERIVDDVVRNGHLHYRFNDGVVTATDTRLQEDRKAWFQPPLHNPGRSMLESPLDRSSDPERTDLFAGSITSREGRTVFFDRVNSPNPPPQMRQDFPPTQPFGNFGPESVLMLLETQKVEYGFKLRQLDADLSAAKRQLRRLQVEWAKLRDLRASAKNEPDKVELESRQKDLSWRLEDAQLKVEQILEERRYLLKVLHELDSKIAKQKKASEASSDDAKSNDPDDETSDQ